MRRTILEASTTQDRAYRVLRETVTALLEEFSLDPRIWSILNLVSEFPEGIRYSEVAERLGVQSPLITMRSKELISSNLIIIIRHKDDFRSKFLKITPNGKKLVKKTNDKLEQKLNLLLTGLDEAELNTYFKVLKIIISNGGQT
jgi:DNA-binding MarR family transcriptional regulator